MAREIELKLSLQPSAVAVLRRHPLLGTPQGRQRLHSVYYDTPDLALLRQGVGVRQRREGRCWLQAVKTAEPASGGLASRSEWESPATPGVFDFSGVDHAAIRAIVTACRDALQPLFVTDCWRTVWLVQYGTAVIEVALDRGQVICGAHRSPICEVELELCEGRLDDLFALALALQREVALQPMVDSKAERGYRLFLDRVAMPQKARPIALSRSMNGVDAFRQIALACLEHLQRNVPMVVVGHAEFVHQARVALRRLRSALRLFAPVLPAAFVAPAVQAWKVLAQSLGAVRDWDVFCAETLPVLQRRFPDEPTLRHLPQLADQRAALARSDLHGVLSSREYSQLLLAFVAALHRLPPHSAELWPLAELRLRGRAWRALRLARRYAKLDDMQRHRLRISFKKLRYALEFFAPLLPARRSKPYLAALAQVQGVLGDYNDHANAWQLAGELADVAGGQLPAAVQQVLAAACTDALAVWMNAESPWQA
ncbi:MAG TPA: CHAD domain-containing protein [Rhodocyclaceae bacterium]|nr:CHAD domain-containing protein [Rhodocyclaceae bacterium]